MTMGTKNRPQQLENGCEKVGYDGVTAGQKSDQDCHRRAGKKADRDPHRAHTEIEHKRAVGKLVPERRCDRGRWWKQQLVDKARGRGKLPHQ
jgi:hypothetical protein